MRAAPARKPFSDRYVFAKVMQDNPDLCREVIEVALGLRIGGVKAIEVESTGAAIDRRSVRYDVFLDSEEAAFEVEMQSYSQRGLPLRMRYYRSMLDRRLLDRGEPFDLLKPVYVIFLCMNDPFGLGLPAYTFAPCLREDPRAEFDNGAVDVVLSAAGDLSLAPAGLAGLLQYVKTGDPAGDRFAARLEAAVDAAYDDEGWVSTMMPIEWDIRDARLCGVDEGLERGRREGRKEGRKEGLRDGLVEGSRLAAERSRALIEAMRSAGASADEILDAVSTGDLEEQCARYGVA